MESTLDQLPGIAELCRHGVLRQFQSFFSESVNLLYPQKNIAFRLPAHFCQEFSLRRDEIDRDHFTHAFSHQCRRAAYVIHADNPLNIVKRHTQFDLAIQLTYKIFPIQGQIHIFVCNINGVQQSPHDASPPCFYASASS